MEWQDPGHSGLVTAICSLLQGSICNASHKSLIQQGEHMKACIYLHTWKVSLWLCRQDLKELKFRPSTDVHDYQVRLRSAQKFIAKVRHPATWDRLCCPCDTSNLLAFVGSRMASPLGHEQPLS